MTKEQFDKSCQELRNKGYKKNFQDGDVLDDRGLNYYYKVIEYREDEYGDNRAINQLLFKIWHFEEFYDRVPKESMYSLEPVVMFSRSTNERIDLTLSDPKFSIDELEEIAVAFGKWADKNIAKKENDYGSY